jgi:hypothetical protein
MGAQRFFSHTPQAPAQVVHNVSQAVRAFMVGGQKVHYDGTDPKTGEKRFRAVSELHDRASKKIKSVPRATPGSFIDFNVNPTITALTPLSSVAGFSPRQKAHTLNSDGLLDVLHVDFARALKELLIILEDIKSLSVLGDLPITYQGSCLRVHFPGCDAGTVERLMEEFALRRGSIGQDEEFDAFTGTEIALLFPFAPSKSGSEYSFYQKPVEQRQDFKYEALLPESPLLDNLSTPDFSVVSDDGLELFEELAEEDINPYLASPSGFETLRSSDVYDSGHPIGLQNPYLEPRSADRTAPLEYQDFEGLYRFIELCNDARR